MKKSNKWKQFYFFMFEIMNILTCQKFTVNKPFDWLSTSVNFHHEGISFLKSISKISVAWKYLPRWMIIRIVCGIQVIIQDVVGVIYYSKWNYFFHFYYLYMESKTLVIFNLLEEYEVFWFLIILVCNFCQCFSIKSEITKRFLSFTLLNQIRSLYLFLILYYWIIIQAIFYFIIKICNFLW